MLNIKDIKVALNNEDYIFADVIKDARFPLGKTAIKPFIEEMRDANNVSVFVDNIGTITGGQIGRYTYREGLHVLGFDGEGNVEKL